MNALPIADVQTLTGGRCRKGIMMMRVAESRTEDRKNLVLIKVVKVIQTLSQLSLRITLPKK